MKIPFSPPLNNELIEREVLDALRSGWITTGPKVRRFETEISSYVGVEHTLCVNSATSALMLALHWYGVGRGDEVIIPAYTYAATALVVLHLGAKPIMIDSGTGFNIEAAQIKEAITSKTKAIITVDIAGNPVQYDEIMQMLSTAEVQQLFVAGSDLQKSFGRPLFISDAAHSFGAAYKGAMVGAWSDLTVFSFHAVKNLTTAEGGCICFNLQSMEDNEAAYLKLRLWSLNGQTKDAFSKSQVGGWQYDIVYPGFKVNMPDILAAIGLAQLTIYKDEILAARKRIFDFYNQALASYPWADCPEHCTEEWEGSCHLYLLRIKGATAEVRNEIINKISKAEVAVNVHFVPLPMLTVFKERGYEIKDYPRAEALFTSEISLPIYPQLDKEQLDYVIATVVNAVEDTLDAHQDT